MTEDKLDLSVVIVNWNVADLLAECLRSLDGALDRVRAEVIVVDNASADHSIELVRRRFPHVRVIENDENLGFTRANNLGISLAKGRYILILNPDTVVLSDTIDLLISFADSTADAGIVGCKQIYPNGALQTTCHRMITLKRESIVALGLAHLFPAWLDYGALPSQATEPFRVEWVGGACLLAQRELLERAGLFDENIFMYAEDADLCQRVRKLGYHIYYLPSARIIHHRGESVSRASAGTIAAKPSLLLRQFGSKRHVIRKHQGECHARAYCGTVAVEMARRWVQTYFADLGHRPSSHRPALKAERSEYAAVFRAALRGRI
jgi:GT2 family glycosyltransferase